MQRPVPLDYEYRTSTLHKSIETLLAVLMFVLMGITLERSKIAEDLLTTMARVFGPLPGGLAVSIVIVGAFLAASTGIVGATVVTMGLLALPTMLRKGYDPAVSTGTICASGTLGQIIPPSIVLVLLGDVLSSAYQQAQLQQGVFAPETVSVGDLFAGALIPGLMLVALYLAYLALTLPFSWAVALVLAVVAACVVSIAALAGIDIHIRYSKGSLLVTHHRIGQRVINRLRKATDGDILVPGGTVSILGTTSERCATPDVIYPEIHEVDHIIDEGAAMLPVLANTRYIRAYCGVRPLISSGDEDGDDRSVSRGFALIDHAESTPGLDNFITISGGKLTTFRLMAEKTADQVCQRLGLCQPCRTHMDPLPQTGDARWTEPGLTPSLWIRQNDPRDMLLCECEMVPQSVVDQLVASIRKQGGDPSLNAIGLRSRIGKGPCQGTFCSQRLAAYLYDRGELAQDQGLRELRSFMEKRWRGQQPLLWDISLAQAELLEAMHSGVFGLEQLDKTKG